MYTLSQFLEADIYQNNTDWVINSRTSHSLESWTSESSMGRREPSSEFPDFKHDRKYEGSLQGLFNKGTNPIKRALLSPNGPSSNIIILGIWISMYKFRGDTNTRSLSCVFCKVIIRPNSLQRGLLSQAVKLSRETHHYVKEYFF